MKTTNFDNWKPHCHYLGELMTPAKGESNSYKFDVANDNYKQAFKLFKNCANQESEVGVKLFDRMMELKDTKDKLEKIKHLPHLSAGAISKLNIIHTQETTGRRKHIKSKYLEKGLMVEEDCITAYSVHTGQFHKKNTEQKENDYLIGTMDFSWNDIAIDTKASWDLWTFNSSKRKKINPIYHWQLDGYMWIEDKQFGRLVYCLLNTPEHLIKAEERKLMYELFGNEGEMLRADEFMRVAYEEECKEIRKHHIFYDLELKDKIKIFDVQRDELRIGQIKRVVEDCRYYLNHIDEIEIAAEVAA